MKLQFQCRRASGANDETALFPSLTQINEDYNKFLRSADANCNWNYENIADKTRSGPNKMILSNVDENLAPD